MKRHAFTLIELTIASAVIVALLSLILPSASALWRLMQLQSSQDRLRHILKVARIESLSLRHSAYGVLFFLDQFNQQSLTYIRWSGIPEPQGPITWPDIANRFDVDTAAPPPETLPRPWRVVPSAGLDRPAIELGNNHYRYGWHRNVFAIVFRHGRRTPYSPLIVRDHDVNADGLGDITNLPVSNVDRGQGVLLKNIVTNAQQQPIPFATEWGIWLYDDQTFSESPLPLRNRYVREHGLPLLMASDAAFAQQ